MRRAVCLLALALSACAEPYANDPVRRGWYAECDYEAQRATAGGRTMADRVGDRVYLVRDCMALKERQAGLR